MALSEQDRAIVRLAERGIGINVNHANIHYDDLSVMFDAARAQGREEARREVETLEEALREIIDRKSYADRVNANAGDLALLECARIARKALSRHVKKED